MGAAVSRAPIVPCTSTALHSHQPQRLPSCRHACPPLLPLPPPLPCWPWQVTRHKAAAIQHIPELLACLSSSPAEEAACSISPEQGCVLSPRYCLLPADLRRLSSLQEVLAAAGLDPAAPTYVLSECVLVYLEPQHSSEVVRWLGSHLQTAAFVVYEQVGRRWCLLPLVAWVLALVVVALVRVLWCWRCCSSCAVPPAAVAAAATVSTDGALQPNCRTRSAARWSFRGRDVSLAAPHCCPPHATSPPPAHGCRSTLTMPLAARCC